MAILGYFKWLDKDLYIPYVNDITIVDDFLLINRNIFNKQQYPPLSYGATSTGAYYQIFEPLVWRNDLTVLYKTIGSDTANCGLETVGDGIFTVMPVYDYENTGLLLGFTDYRNTTLRIFKPSSTNSLNEQLEDNIYLAVYKTSTNTYLSVNQVSNGEFIQIYNMLLVTVYDSNGTLNLDSTTTVLNYLKLYDGIPPSATPINFYANPSKYNTNKGETVTPNFVIVYDDNTIVEPYTDVVYDDSIYFKDNIASISDDGISIIISPDNNVKRLEFTVRPNIPDTELWTIFSIMVDDVENPYYDEDSSGIGGGNGSYGQGENYFDTLGKIPNGSAEANDSRGTMYTRYLVSLNEMSTLGDWLWADDLGLQVAKTAISLLYGDPVQTVISCVSYPFNLSNLASSSSVPFHWGGHDAGFNLSALNQNAFSIDWGTITISEYWGNFLDYSPHTQMQLYLPWGTGFVHIDPNDILKSNSSSSLTGRGTLGIKTNVDLSRGICVHNVIANNTVIGSYSGSCGRQIPITGSDYASKQVSMAGAAIGAMVAGGVSSGMGAAEGSARAIRTYDSSGVGYRGPKPITVTRRFNTDAAVEGFSQAARTAFRPAVASAAALAVSPPSVSRSGSFQEGAGSLSIQQPYLIISRPKMSMPKNYGHLYGYPSNITASLGSLTGYTEVGAIHIDGISATSQEIEEIESLLMGGVIL